MGAIVSVASLAFCCACTGVSCACSCAGCCLSSAAAAAGGISCRVAKFFYLLELVAVVLLCVALRYSADNWSWEAYGYEFTIGCSNSTSQIDLDLTGQTDDGVYAYCKGDGAVYRVCAATACFYALHVLLSLCGTRFHRGFWLWKLLLHAGAIVGFIFLDPSMFDDEGFVWAARSFSVAFFFLQILLMIGFAYDWNDKWLANSERSDQSEKCWLGLIVACVVALYVGVFAGIALLYSGYASCSVGAWVTTVTLIGVLTITALTLTRDRYSEEPGAMLPAAVISAYITYLAWAALESNPDADCKPFALDDPGASGVVGVGVIVLAISLAWGANQSSASATALLRGGHAVHEPDAASSASSASAASGLYEVGEGRTAADMRRDQEPTRRASEGVSKGADGDADDNVSVIVFHLVMIVSVLYLAMVMTNWGAAESAASGGGTGQMWLRIACQWLSLALFLWTIVAPAILTNRDFSSTRPGSSASSSNTGSTARPPAKQIQLV